MKYLFILSLLIFKFSINQSFAQASIHNLQSKVIADNLFIPWEITFAEEAIWFTQKNGYICKLNLENGSIDTLYHQPLTVIQGEGGMLGMALHPEFPQKPYVFVAYEYLSGSEYKERIVRLTYNQNALIEDSIILDGITGSRYHNGCRLLIANDKLFITTGDAEVPSLAQDLNSWNGKILRINLDGSIPDDNPIPGSPIWSWGHRNAQGLTFANNKIYSSEHGPNDNDEINIIEKARNYGWPNVRGYCDLPSELQFCQDSNVVEPIVAWTPTIAPSGIDYYNSERFPALKNSLLLATLKDEHLYQLQLNETGDSIFNALPIPNINVGRIRDVCVTPTGRIFIATSNSSADGSQQIDKILELYDSTSLNIKNEHLSPKQINIFPNPTQKVLYLKPELKDFNVTYSIIDINGKIIRNGIIKNNSVDIQELNPGLYFLKLPLISQTFQFIKVD